MTRDQTGNLPPLPGIFPDYPAPIVRAAEGGGRELVMARWGMPSSKKALLDAATRRADKLRAKGEDVDFTELLRMEPDAGTTNVRNTASAHWKRWLGPRTAASSPSPPSASSTVTTAATSGSPWARTGRWRASPGSGRRGPASARK